MKKLLGILVLSLLWCNVGVAEEIDEYLSSSNLYKECKVAEKAFVYESSSSLTEFEKVKAVRCLSFFDGLFLGAMTQHGFDKEIFKNSGKFTENVLGTCEKLHDRNQWIRIFNKYYEDHPNETNTRGYILAAKALLDALPCDEQKTSKKKSTPIKMTPITKALENCSDWFFLERVSEQARVFKQAGFCVAEILQHIKLNELNLEKKINNDPSLRFHTNDPGLGSVKHSFDYYEYAYGACEGFKRDNKNFVKKWTIK